MAADVRAMWQWKDSLVFPAAVLIGKPSFSGTRAGLSRWRVSGLKRDAAPLIQYLHKMLVVGLKPYVLIQPYIKQLKEEEFRCACCRYILCRLFFVQGEFVSCLRTHWRGKTVVCEPVVPAPDVMVELGKRVVDLLPSDSVLYRVDMFLWNDAVCVNEVEMVDACLFAREQVWTANRYKRPQKLTFVCAARGC
jgi:hypothetical protein